MSDSEAERNVMDLWRALSGATTAWRKDCGKLFVFFEGPPTANGKPGIHDVAARAFKDLYPRYKTMRGYKVLRRAG